MYLAQLNIAKAKYSMDAPEIKGFVDNLDAVNKIADSSKGFVWRLQDESGDATSIQAFDDPNIIVNMSVWESVKDLKNFIYHTHHRDILRQKKEWFQSVPEDTYVLWWVPVGFTPTIEEAVERLMHLRENGDSAYAFTLRSEFEPPK